MLQDAVGYQLLDQARRGGRQLAQGNRLTQLSRAKPAEFDDGALPSDGVLPETVIATPDPPIVNQVHFRLWFERWPAVAGAKALTQDFGKEWAPHNLAHWRRAEQKTAKCRLRSRERFRFLVAERIHFDGRDAERV